MNDAIYIEITAVRGSTPRDVGTAMKVTAQEIAGTIGGGALEHQAIMTARQMLSDGRAVQTLKIPLGPNLGQCCGGAVTLRFSHEERPTDAEPAPNHGPLLSGPPRNLWLWGAGHVGRAVVAHAPAKAFDITWVDRDLDRFPSVLPDAVTVVPALDMPRLALRAPLDAHHLIFTYSHDIDLALCAALLTRSAASIGLIGSDTKLARFSKRLDAMGLDPSQITCPIGDKRLGKRPSDIAQGVVATLLADARADAPSKATA